MTQALGPSVLDSSVGASVDSVRKSKVKVITQLTFYWTPHRAVCGRARVSVLCGATNLITVAGLLMAKFRVI